LHFCSNDKDSQTPLTYAARCGRIVIVEYLLREGADVNGRPTYTELDQMVGFLLEHYVLCATKEYRSL